MYYIDFFKRWLFFFVFISVFFIFEQASSAISLEFKISQMLMMGVTYDTPNTEIDRLIADDCIGGLMLYGKHIPDKSAISHWVSAIHERHKNTVQLPLFMAVDMEGGIVQRIRKGLQGYPAASVVFNTLSLEESHQLAKRLGADLLDLGFNMNFAPVLDVIQASANHVIGSRSFGSDPMWVGLYGSTYVDAFNSASIIPVIKHFPGHGHTVVDSHIDLPVSTRSLDDLSQVDIVPFKYMIQNHSPVAVMLSHVLYQKIDPNYPASLSHKIVQTILRDSLGFDGLVITDDLSMGAITTTFGFDDAVIRSVNAGVDILLFTGHSSTARKAIQVIGDAVKRGDILESRINESFDRISAVKEMYLM